MCMFAGFGLAFGASLFAVCVYASAKLMQWVLS